MPRPYRNPDFPADRRQRYIMKRILEESAAMERIARDTLSPRRRTLPNIVKNYLARIRKRDHVTYLILSQVVSGLRIGVPTTPRQILDIDQQRDRISQLMGTITDGTDAISIARELNKDPVTGDLEFVYFNAKLREEQNDNEQATDRYTGTMRRRMEKKIEISERPWSIRRRILDDENDRGII